MASAYYIESSEIEKSRAKEETYRGETIGRIADNGIFYEVGGKEYTVKYKIDNPNEAYLTSNSLVQQVKDNFDVVIFLSMFVGLT